jgi:hypothetical protein
LRPDETSVAEFMPSDASQYMSDADLVDILAYISPRSPSLARGGGRFAVPCDGGIENRRIIKHHAPIPRSHAHRARARRRKT